MRLAMTHRQILNALGGYRDFASRHGYSPIVVWRWQQRGIPAKHWPTIIADAEARGIEGITAETLMNARYGAAA